MIGPIGVKFSNPLWRWRNCPAQLASSLGGQIGVVSSSRTVTSTRASTLVSSCADPPSLEKHYLEKASRILIWLARLVAPASPSSRNTSDIFWSCGQCGHLPVSGRNFVICTDCRQNPSCWSIFGLHTSEQGALVALFTLFTLPWRIPYLDGWTQACFSDLDCASPSETTFRFRLTNSPYFPMQLCLGSLRTCSVAEASTDATHSCARVSDWLQLICWPCRRLKVHCCNLIWLKLMNAWDKQRKHA